MTVSVIAIDGPGGSGKTSVSRSVAQRLRLPHLDTGAYYRAATLAVLSGEVDPADAVRRGHLCRAGRDGVRPGQDVARWC